MSVYILEILGHRRRGGVISLNGGGLPYLYLSIFPVNGIKRMHFAETSK